MREVIHLPEIKDNFLTGERHAKKTPRNFKVRNDTSLCLLHCFFTMASQEMAPSFRRQAKTANDDMEPAKKPIILPEINPNHHQKKKRKGNRMPRKQDSISSKWKSFTTVQPTIQETNPHEMMKQKDRRWLNHKEKNCRNSEVYLSFNRMAKGY